MSIKNNQKVKDTIEGLNKPLEFSDSWNFLKSGRVKITIIYEDESYKDYYKKLSEDYVITIKNKKYLIIPKCILRGKFNTFIYYYNNPMPINFKYENSKLSSKILYSDDVYSKLPDNLQMSLADTYLDAKALQVAFTSNLINKMYSENKMSTMNWIIILVVIVVIILVFLQVFGVVDIFGLLGVQTK